MSEQAKLALFFGGVLGTLWVAARVFPAEVMIGFALSLCAAAVAGLMGAGGKNRQPGAALRIIIRI